METLYLSNGSRVTLWHLRLTLGAIIRHYDTNIWRAMKLLSPDWVEVCCPHLTGDKELEPRDWYRIDGFIKRSAPELLA